MRVITVEKIEGLKNVKTNKTEGTPSELFGYVWDMTVEVCRLSGQYDVEQGLQRHIGMFVKRGS
ncbi:hypothetical protein AGMMS50293_07890 [Spirochaetia bacterium]|nr:hypothetical protein AGMMS50293_07890 [Spirochaetia bacterium]